jgi:hypothetical protein
VHREDVPQLDSPHTRTVHGHTVHGYDVAELSRIAGHFAHHLPALPAASKICLTTRPIVVYTEEFSRRPSVGRCADHRGHHRQRPLGW